MTGDIVVMVRKDFGLSDDCVKPEHCYTLLRLTETSIRHSCSHRYQEPFTTCQKKLRAIKQWNRKCI